MRNPYTLKKLGRLWRVEFYHDTAYGPPWRENDSYGIVRRDPQCQSSKLILIFSPGSSGEEAAFWLT